MSLIFLLYSNFYILHFLGTAVFGFTFNDRVLFFSLDIRATHSICMLHHHRIALSQVQRPKSKGQRPKSKGQGIFPLTVQMAPWLPGIFMSPECVTQIALWALNCFKHRWKELVQWAQVTCNSMGSWKSVPGLLSHKSRQVKASAVWVLWRSMMLHAHSTLTLWPAKGGGVTVLLCRKQVAFLKAQTSSWVWQTFQWLTLPVGVYQCFTGL